MVPGPRVLVCTQGFPRWPGDAHAPFVLDHARALAAAGATVTILCPSAPGLAARERWGDVDVVRFRYAPRRLELLGYGGAMHRRVLGPHGLLLPFFLAGFLVAGLRHARSADVIHAHWWAPSGVVAVVAGRLLGVATAVQLHGTDAAIARGPLRTLARLTLRRADVVLAGSTDLVDFARRVAGLPAVLAPMPLAVERCAVPSPPPADGPVLAIGRLVPEKGFDVLIRAAAAARVPVVLVGDGGQRRNLEDLARSTGAEVQFMGTVAPAGLAELYRAARIVAVPSRREGFGLVAAEAAASGRAVVASAVGGLPDTVGDGVNGLLVPPGDVAAWTRALAEVDPTLGAQGPAAVAWLRPAPIAGRHLAAYADARATVRPPAGPRLARVAAALLAVAALVSCAFAISRRWDDVRGLDVSWSPGPVALAVVAVVGANLLLAWGWGWLVRGLGGDLGWAAGMRVWWTGQLGRYLPTGLGSVPARIALGLRMGVPRRPLVVATAAEPAVIVATCAATAALLLPGPLAAAVGPAALLLAGAILARTAGLAPRKAAGFVAVQQGQLLLRAVGFTALLSLFEPVARPSPALAAGVMGLAYLLGFLAVFAPGGVGVREAALVAALASVTGVAAVAAAAIAWRLLELAVELPLLAWARTLARPTAPPPERARAYPSTGEGPD